MEVILLEKIRNLGDIGSKVIVKPGHARNYLIPQGKAALATAENLEKFTKIREELEQKAALALERAKQRAAKIEEHGPFTMAVKATEEGKLFGSVNALNIAETLEKSGFTVEKNEISLPQGAIRQTGEFEVTMLLHSDITIKIKINVVALA